MGSTVNHDPANVCAENISFLFLLHSVPTLPSRNTLETQRKCAQGYTLSLEEERQLVESLAFLANDSDDANHIPAICIEQDLTTSSMNVWLAVNCARWQAGIQSLRRLKIGFEGIFFLLANAGQHTENDVLSAIVSMCKKRILLRLRLSQRKRDPPKQFKQTIQQILRSVIECFSRLGLKRLDDLDKLSSLFIKEARLVIRLADDWINRQTDRRLKELVDSVYQLKRTVDTETLLGRMTTREMDPSSRQSLINIINKIARYREIALYLYRISKKNDLLRQMRLITIDLPVEAYVRPPRVYATSTLGSVLARAQKSFHKADVTRIRRYINPENVDINAKFASQLTKTLTGSKIHAEIQLLYYYESNPSSRPPRVIASSKDACFLCNAFIHMHGKMHTARTHGRLYPGWRLPFTPTFMSLEQSFNMLLANQIDASLATLLSRTQKTVYPFPNESTLLLLPHSASTLCSLLVAQDEAEGQNTVSPLLPGKTRIVMNTDTTISKPEEELKEESEKEPGEAFKEESGQSEDQSQEAFKDQFERRSMNSGPKEAVNGKGAKSVDAINVENIPNGTSTASFEAIPEASNEVEMIKGQSIVLERSVKFLRAGKLHLHLEYPDQTALLQRAQTFGNVTHLLAWLDDMEVERLMTSEGTVMNNMGELGNETTCEINSQGCLFIAARGVVVRITVRSERAEAS